PFKVNLVSTGVLPWMSNEIVAVPVPVSVNATAGTAKLVFNGTASDAMHLKDLSGRFTLSGSSLADAGKPFGVTLPTTGAFRTAGIAVKQGPTWRVLVEDATVGSSKLNGAFTYESSRAVPLLIGKLGGSRLLLSDLGPAIGAAPASTTNTASDAGNLKKTSAPGKVLPDRKFELASLRVMDANVIFDVAEVDLNTTLLEPFRPLHGHIQLFDGVLKLTDISASTAQGTLTGAWVLDGRGNTGLWNADMRWENVQLDRWLHQKRAKDAAPPFISGSLRGSAKVRGQGQSTAEILATLKGRVFSELEDGEMSHLIIELAGLDIAQGLGLLFKGDEQLPVDCAVTELVAENGVFQSRVTVIDTPDSTLFVDGTISLGAEALDLRAVVTPKDFSPLTLRTPLQVRGTFGNPQVAVDKGALTRKVGSAVLLGLLNPLAALIPLADRGDKATARKRASGCEALARRGSERLKAPVRIK
ncbi:MAG: AsmA family protein, partial [Betaproteobacteria bacterium]